MSTNPNDAMMEFAAEYSLLDWYIFPCAPGQKSPVVKWRAESTRNPVTICDWWRRWPLANIGVDCGKSNLYIIDLDDGEKGYDEFCEMLNSPIGNIPISKTGAGYQLFFRNPGNLKNTTRKLGAHIDTRGSGGYAILPPSVHPSGARYYWINPPTRGKLIEPPNWLIPPEKPASPVEITQPINGTGGKWLAQAIQRAGPGTRNATGFWLATMLRDDGLPAGEIAEKMQEYARAVRDRGDHPYTEFEALASIKSALSTPRRSPAAR